MQLVINTFGSYLRKRYSGGTLRAFQQGLEFGCFRAGCTKFRIISLRMTEAVTAEIWVGS